MIKTHVRAGEDSRAAMLLSREDEGVTSSVERLCAPYRQGEIKSDETPERAVNRHYPR